MNIIKINYLTKFDTTIPSSHVSLTKLHPTSVINHFKQEILLLDSFTTFSVLLTHDDDTQKSNLAQFHDSMNVTMGNNAQTITNGPLA